ncbi:MAG: hypothetical protein IJX51_00710, partial [Clostridia bacterium]|nr:hypothetical protein [Clostridia bacterium]
MKIIKRSGEEVIFDINKIVVAIRKANNSVAIAEQMSELQIKLIAENVEKKCAKVTRSLSVEEIQDIV